MNNGKINSIVTEKFYVIILFVIMLAAILYCFNPNIASKMYKEYTVDYTQYENYAENRLDGLLLKDGIMTSNKDINFMVLGDRSILDKPIKTITLNVSNLSCAPVEGKLYVLDTYERYDFIIKEGKCNVILQDANVLNGGEAPVLIRIDLLNKAGERIKVDSVVFNDPDVCYDAAFDGHKNKMAQYAIALTLILFAVYILRIGLIKAVPDNGEIGVFLLCMIIGFVIKKYIGDNLLMYVILGIALMFGVWFIYYYTTVYVFEKIKIFKCSIQTVTSLLFIVLLSFLYYISEWLFLIFAFYPLYLLGYYISKFDTKIKYKIPMLLIGVLNIILLIVISLRTGNLQGQYINLGLNSSRVYLLSSVFLASISVVLLSLGIEDRQKIRNAGFICAKTAIPITFAYSFAIIRGIEVSLIPALIGLVISFAICLIITYFYPKMDNVLMYSEKGNLKIEKNIIKGILTELFLVILVLFFEGIIKYMLFDMSVNEIFLHFCKFIFTPVFAYNLMLINIVYFFFIFFLGTGIGTLLFSFLNFLFFLGNFIKLKYHDAMLKPGDLLQIKDFLSIVGNSFKIQYIFIVIVAVALIALIIFVIYKLRKFFKPRFYFLPVIIFAVILYGMCSYISANKFNDIGITSVDKWLDDELKTERQGFYIFTYYNILSIKDIIPVAPDNYSSETMIALEESFDKLNDNNIKSDIKPDVIMLMMESVFDIEAVPGLSFNDEVEKNIKHYKTLDMISPRFGGGTANIEFEALTGFSSYFIADNVVPYVTYWNDEDDNIPSIAYEFKNNGYETLAIHPNNEKFYNRDIVYKAMGFDDFISIEDMKAGILRNKRGYVLNTEMLDIMTEKIEENDTPKFMFALNIENHNPYDVKDPNGTVEISGNISDDDRREAEIYSDTLKNDDKMIGDIIEYVKNTERPTLLYIWGDHLPMLSVLTNTGYINDINNKYTTPVIMYSNYKQIGTDLEKFTPNQFATQVLKDAGINYSPYFDFIYSLREKYPVIHKEFGIDADDELIKKYEEVQYDLLFGKKYLKSGEGQ